jgi:hypothetical protein
MLIQDRVDRPPWIPDASRENTRGAEISGGKTLLN